MAKTGIYSKIITLAWPIIMSHMGHMMASIADSVMAGQLGEIPLAAIGLSNTIYAFVLLFGIGLATGLLPLVAKAEGKKDIERNKSLFKHGLIMNVLAGIILSILMILILPVIPYMDQPSEVVEEARSYYLLLSASTFFSMVFFHFKQFGEGIQLVKTTMWVTLWGNLLNIFLNFLFIKGWMGMPQLGSFGIGLATLISRIIMAIALIAYFNRSRMRQYMHAYSSVKFNKTTFKYLFWNSIPIAFQYIIEMSAFAVGFIMTGWFGATSQASHQIAINIATTTYLVAAGLGSATSILIGNAFGRKDLKMLNEISKKSVILVFSSMTIFSIMMIFGRDFLPSLYINKIEVISLASTLLIIAALFQLFDGLQVVGLGVLRGMNDLIIPTYIAMFSYWIITVPVCYILSVIFNYEALGVWIGFLVGLIFSSVLIFVRIHNRKKNLIRKFS